jgi:hypothetical protein
MKTGEIKQQDTSPRLAQSAQVPPARARALAALRLGIGGATLGLMLSVAIPTSAANATDELRHAAGAYVYVMDIVAIVRRSPCGYALAPPGDGMAQALNDIARHMRPEDFRELQAFVQGEEFRQVHRGNQKLVESWFEALAAYNYDEKTQCETIAASVINVYEVAREQWERAKQGRAP